tara:strand:- start:134 stop:847 length:714 start_codon:yes stop_codon:yes gene_type:complete
MLDNANSIPMVSGRSETGTIDMQLYDDNSLEFTITINDLSATDVLTAAHVHTGDVVSTGAVVIGLVDGATIMFSGNTANGTLMLDASQISALNGDDVYVNVHSTENPSGLVRGQIDVAIDNSYNVALSTDNEVPSVTGRSETGVTYFRLVNSTMYYKVVVNDLEVSDAITKGHIHEGATGINGSVFINLEITDNTQLDTVKSVTLNASDLAKINNDQLYVNIHSSQVASGLIRGQIR